MTMAPERLAPEPLSGRIGAAVAGLRLDGGLDPAIVGELRAALLTHRVLFFRGQGHLDAGAQQAFARLLGPLTLAHPTAATDAAPPRVWAIDAERGGRANHWHTDVTFVAAPPAISVLRAVRVPAVGGDTLWANTVAAYDSVPAAVRPVLDDLWARHSNQFDYADRGEDPRPGADDYRRRFTASRLVADHPVVTVHPETGERSLLLGGHARAVRGVGRADSERFTSLVQGAVTRPEHTVRWRWEAGDVAVWDNRATQHYAINDYGDVPRLMHRVTVAGEPAVSVSGERSRQVEGDPGAYLAG
jgi:taurine dioxygenase